MLTIEERTILAIRWHRYFEGLIYVECLAHGITKTPVLEIKPDGGSYQKTGLIHIGYGSLQVETPEELFSEMHFLLGHEMQHLLSSTFKDFEAAQKLCFRDACTRLSVRVFGRTRRLSKESDYQQFFSDLADKGIFLNRPLLSKFTCFILNSLEDGRIESIRVRKHPGFAKYRKAFNGKVWLSDDFRDEPFFTADPDDLDDFGKLQMCLSQILYLAVSGIYQKGFLGSYGGTKAHDYVASFIPEISRAVIAPTCRECMDQGRIIFDRLLDLMIDVCSVEADAKKLEEMINELISRMLEDLEKMQMSASPKSEETGDGLPAESIFGHTELEVEVDEETYEKLQEELEEADEDAPGVKLKVKKKSEDTNDTEESEDGESASGGAAETASEEEGSSSSSESGTDSEGSEYDSSSSDGTDGSDGDTRESEGSSDASSETENPSGNSSSDSGSDDGEETSSGMTAKSEHKGNDNIVSSASESSMTDEELRTKLEEAMTEAAKSASADFALAEADAKADEAFSEAAEKLSPVAPKPIPMGDIDARYGGYVDFVESTRKYSPTGRLPLELENKGKSLDRRIDQLIKNKQEPDLRFLRSGMLDTRRIANLAMGDIDVFKKKGEPVKSDVAGFLLMDNSGSMGDGPGSTRYACCNAFAVLEEGFKEHMPLKIAAFDAAGTDKVMHEVIKEFDEVAPANLSFNFRDLGRSGWGNKDGYSIRVAAKQLSMRPEKDKILIIASDGFPTEYRGGFDEGIADVKSAVEEARKAGIRTIGMYMYRATCSHTSQKANS